MGHGDRAPRLSRRREELLSNDRGVSQSERSDRKTSRVRRARAEQPITLPGLFHNRGVHYNSTELAQDGSPASSVPDVKQSRPLLLIFRGAPGRDLLQNGKCKGVPLSANNKRA